MTRWRALVLCAVLTVPAGAAAIPAAATEPAAAGEGEAEALLDEARAAMRRGEFAPAVDLLSRVIELDPDILAAHLNLATSLRRLGRHDEAQARLLQASERFPDSPEPLVMAGYLNRALGRLDESARWFERASMMEGGWYNHIRLAVTYTDLGDLEAMRRAAAALKDSPYGEALGRTLQLLYERKFDRARAVAERELAREEDDLWRSLAADLSALAGDYARAVEHYSVMAPELLEEPPAVGRSNGNEAIWLAFILDRSGDGERAEALARGALEAFAPSEHEHVNVKVYRMAAQVLLGRNDRALAELRDAVDAGYRSILFERMVRMDRFEMLAPLRDDPAFRSMIATIEADNARMLRRLRGAPPEASPERSPVAPGPSARPR